MTRLQIVMLGEKKSHKFMLPKGLCENARHKTYIKIHVTEGNQSLAKMNSHSTVQPHTAAMHSEHAY